MSKFWKIGSLLLCIISLIGCGGNVTNENNSEEISENTYLVDYYDSASFEKALNDGEKVNGKIVLFDVKEYKPKSALGINCWSGEHLNFISQKEIAVKKGDSVIARITEEPSKKLNSWIIPYDAVKVNPKDIKQRERITASIEQEETKKTESTTKETVTQTEAVTQTQKATEKKAKNLTVENSPELAAMLSNKADMDSSYEDFAKKYKGKIIEFDGSVDYLAKAGNYKTRYDVLLSVEDYDQDHQIGPVFKYSNVNITQMNTDGDIRVGDNVRVVAEVDRYDANSGLFFLKPISTKHR